MGQANAPICGRSGGVPRSGGGGEPVVSDVAPVSAPVVLPVVLPVVVSPLVVGPPVVGVSVLVLVPAVVLVPVSPVVAPAAPPQPIDPAQTDTAKKQARGPRSAGRPEKPGICAHHNISRPRRSEVSDR